MPKGLGGLINNVTKTARDLNNAATRANREVNNAANTANRLGQTVKKLTGGKKDGGKQEGNQQAQDNASWTCACGTSSTGKFCGECGKAQTVQAVCSCGWKRPADNAVKFCGECGTKFES